MKKQKTKNYKKNLSNYLDNFWDLESKKDFYKGIIFAIFVYIFVKIKYIFLKWAMF